MCEMGCTVFARVGVASHTAIRMIVEVVVRWKVVGEGDGRSGGDGGATRSVPAHREIRHVDIHVAR